MIVSSHSDREVIHQAESPVASPDGRWLAFLREEHGRNRIWLRVLNQPGSTDKILTSAELNVAGDVVSAEWLAYLFGGAKRRAARSVPRRSGRIGQFARSRRDPLPSGLSDGHWFAYSKLQGGNWHLWLRDFTTARPAD